jgi:hypothetical protein
MGNKEICEISSHQKRNLQNLFSPKKKSAKSFLTKKEICKIFSHQKRNLQNLFSPTKKSAKSFLTERER